MKHNFSSLMTLIFLGMTLAGCASEVEQADTSADSLISSQTETTVICSGTDAPVPVPAAPTEEITEAVPTEHFSEARTVELYEVDGQEQTYAFSYNGETFYAVYTPDNWKIIDSWRITEPGDIELICQALTELHPIHGADMESYRTAKDMADEWLQHNFAYRLLPDDSPWKQSAKDVDIDPGDQGKSIFDRIIDELT